MNWDSMVMDASSRQAFSRGERLASKGAASKTSASKSADGARLTVEGDVEDGSQTYHATAQIDPKKGEVVSHGCTCGNADGELCKHGVCLLLCYQDMKPAAAAAPSAATAGAPAPAATKPAAAAATKGAV